MGVRTPLMMTTSFITSTSANNNYRRKKFGVRHRIPVWCLTPNCLRMLLTEVEVDLDIQRNRNRDAVLFCRAEFPLPQRLDGFLVETEAETAHNANDLHGAVFL